VGGLPFALRALANRNRETRRRFYGETAALDRSLLDSAERLRPFRNMKALHFQQQRELVREHLVEAREERKTIDSRLERTRLSQPPAKGWPGEFFIRQPAHYVNIPLDTWHLWQAGRLISKIKTSLEAANKEQETLHDLPNALRQAAVDLREQSLPALVRAIQTEKAVGLGRLDPIELRLQQLQKRTAALAGRLIAGTAVEDNQTDELAVELESITEIAVKIEEELTTIHQRRIKIDEYRRRSLTNYETLRQALPISRVPENLASVIQHIDVLYKDADMHRSRLEFDQGERCLNAAQKFSELSQQLYATGQTLEQLADIQSISPLAEKIIPILNQWSPLIQQTRQLLQPPDEMTVSGVKASLEMAVRIQSQAQKVLDEHQQVMNQIESQADKALDELAAAWDKVQAITPLAGPDPLAQSYHALWPKREAARGVPQLMETFIAESGQLTRQIDGTRSNLQDHQRQMQEMLGRLPKILAEAQTTAEDWLSLQRLSEQLAAIRAALDERYQIAFTANTIESVNSHIAQFQSQVDQLFYIQEELRFEANEIERLDTMIRQHWEALQQNSEGISEAKYNRAVRMTDTQYENALSAERPKDTRAALEKCLSYVEKLALN
jgi:hypothetical protein